MDSEDDDSDEIKRKKIKVGTSNATGTSAAKSASPSIPKKDYVFDLKLGQSNDSTYPEFSWKLLVQDVQKKEIAKKSASGKPTLDPYASDDEDDLKAMAARFEVKYGKGTVGPQDDKRQLKPEDYIDRGAGYDENDSFIDNSQIYDEIVPEEIQPVHGGFYINSGRLDFKEVDTSDPEINEVKKPKEQVPNATGIERTAVGATDSDKSKNTKETAVNTKFGKRPSSIPESPSKIALRKSSASSTSESSSPKRSRTERARTVTISSSDSSSESSRSSTSSSSSEVELEEVKDLTKLNPSPQVAMKDILLISPVPNNSAPVSGASSASNTPTSTPQRRLKVKNVPLNPKLHGPGSSAGSTPVQSPKPIVNSPKPVTTSGDIVSKPGIPGLTAIQPHVITTTKSVSSPKASPSAPASKGFTVPTRKIVTKQKAKRRVTDRQPPVQVKRPTPSLIESQTFVPKDDQLKTPKKIGKVTTDILSSPHESPKVLPIKRTRKRSTSSLLKPEVATTSSSPVSAPSVSSAGHSFLSLLTQEQQIQAFHLQLQAAQQLTNLGLSPLAAGLLGIPSLQSPFQNGIQSQHHKKTPPSTKNALLTAELQSQATAMALKNLSQYQSQLGSGVTLSEVKKTKSNMASPSSKPTVPKTNLNPTVSRKVNTNSMNPQRLSLPSSLTVVPSGIKSQTSKPPSTGSPVPSTSSVSSSYHPMSFTTSIQPSTSSLSKVFTPFDVNALLSRHFDTKRNNSAGK